MKDTTKTEAMRMKPCPFCCSDDLFTQAALGCIQVVCETCEASGPTEETDEDAIEAWNRLGLSRSADSNHRASTPQADAAPDRCYAPGCHQWDGTSTCTCAAIAAGGAQEPDVFEWLETELSAISCRYHGDPSYDHDAYWMKDRVMKLIDDARKAFPLPREAATAWQPIETAPRGAKGYCWMNLAWGTEGDVSTGIGMRWGDRFFAVGSFYCLGQERRYEFREIEVQPTHWMPLPADPAASNGEQEAQS